MRGGGSPVGAPSGVAVKPGGVPWARGPLRGRTSDSPGGTPLYGMVWYGMVWYGMVWYGMVWYGMVWYGMVWYGMVWYGMVWYGMVWYGMVWYGMVWYGMVWYGMVWYGMVWYGMVWYGMLLMLLLLWHPARAGGKKCQARSPWAGRKGAVARRHAGRACADDDRGGGGGSAFCLGGGGGARRCERDHLRCDPGSLPRRGGRARAPVRNGGGMGGGMEGPPVRGSAGPWFPLLPAATPPRQGRGLRPVRRWSKGVEGAGAMYGLFLCWGAAAAEGPQRGAALARSTWLRRGVAWD